MIPVQPVGIWDYLGKKKHIPVKGLAARFYLSWEDGLWDIVRSFALPKKSVAYVPSFFCVDVLENMRVHGLEPRYYPVDKHLQPGAKELLAEIHKTKPAMLILFHPVGIKNRCVSKNFFQKLPDDLLIIEDASHCLVDPSSVQIFCDNHFCITSLRKVVPLQGSFVYGKKDTIQKLHGPEKSTIVYSSVVVGLWMLMQTMLMLQKYLPNVGNMQTWCGLLAEYVMKKGYDRIGDEEKPGYCPSLFARIFAYVDVQKIRRIKREQVEIYEKFFHSMIRQKKSWYVPNYADVDKGELRGFPIVMNDAGMIAKLREHGILVREELAECPWTRARTITYLPLGPHIALKSIEKLSIILADG